MSVLPDQKFIDILFQLLTELPPKERVSFSLIGKKFEWGEFQTEKIIRSLIQKNPKLGYINSFTKEFIRSSSKIDKSKSNTYSEVRKKYPNAFKKWSSQEDNELIAKYREGTTIAKLADYFQRTRKAIRIRLENLGIIN